MEYSKQDRQKLNGEGILANREAIIKLRQIINTVHCGFVVCNTCPYNTEEQENSCGFVQINNILNKLVK
jgi:protein-arginine kinase activator protein McsA